MNDDLEQELAELRPAAPPSDLLRRLRATPPSTRANGFRLFTFAKLPGFLPDYTPTTGLLAALILLTVAWWTSLPRSGHSVHPVLTVQVTPRPLRSDGATHPGTPLSSDPIISTPAPDPTRDIAAQNSLVVVEDGQDAVSVFSRLRVGLDAGLAALGSSAQPLAGSDFDLQTVGSPIRLGGDFLPGSGLREPPFGKFNLKVNDQF